MEQALEMPPDERLTFAKLILESIAREEDEIRQAWIEEVNDRMKAVNEGKARLLNFEVFYTVKIKIHELAAQEFDEATEWYELQSKGLGKRFKNK